MKRRVLSLQQFIKESLSDSYMSIVRNTLLNNKKRIMAEAEISDEVFDLVVDKMTTDRPESLVEDNLINDAIVFSKDIATSVEFQNLADEINNNPNSSIPQFQN